MVNNKTEEEQIEAVKQWWSENGRAVIFAVFIGLSGSFGWQFWQEYNQDKREEAAREYWEFIEFLEEDYVSIEVSRPELRGNELKSNFPKSSYSKFAAMHLSKLYVETDILDRAEEELRWVISSSSADDAIYQLAIIRLARVLAATNNSDQAIEILSSNEGTFFKALRATVLGDILWSLDNEEAALEEYQKARSLSDSGFIPPRLTEKLNFLSSASDAKEYFDSAEDDAEKGKVITDESKEE